MAKRKKRGNGEGSIYRKADGRWVTQYTAETAQGTKRKTLYGKTRREVAEKLRVTLSEKDAVKSRSFCNFLQGGFPCYRSMRITPSDSRSSWPRSARSPMSR